MKDEAEFYSYCLPLLDGREQCLKDFAGQVLLIVNTASLCGFTPQYQGLQTLYERYRTQGFSVLAFPCNQFAHQEPGNADAIGDVCYGRFAVSFPVFAKLDVNGPQAHPLFQYLKTSKPGWLGPRISWNFTKFLIDRSGTPRRRYSPRVTPQKIAPAIEALLQGR
ncbi:glutathione peroxidase [Acidithiobacillus acidisediminis]|jgi:glutathione peroxidase|uniref:glutathione peroxidase n=1 Tax=Acidithiobacillus TaxID=119977 RepID=UPI00200F30BC|nr:glutathione peroxidase [Acidithiobacillus sp. S30A2]